LWIKKNKNNYDDKEERWEEKNSLIKAFEDYKIEDNILEEFDI